MDTIPTNSRWMEKEPKIRQDFIWGAGPSAIETITEGEFKTDPEHRHTSTHTTIKRLSYAQRQHHSRGDFLWQSKTKMKHRKNTGGN